MTKRQELTFALDKMRRELQQLIERVQSHPDHLPIAPELPAPISEAIPAFFEASEALSALLEALATSSPVPTNG